ncbi:hypothetical protein H696_04359 [Fonticula alba]|uniref:Cytochrome b5 heme-binding domain-containing protein n=1 Tax=Fonticula alba TaxID=691883 RepID=A0A058Z3W2_FONAL|nr:hypothetical protein H696_04359 [Fonticula alba]KCV68940.1 hypothetical protein H696_04359 [Fonticula alba]|eukprot:XP_009496511.1 hypothetical protein H696_04359 [Fonticula alba]
MSILSGPLFAGLEEGSLLRMLLTNGFNWFLLALLVIFLRILFTPLPKRPAVRHPRVICLRGYTLEELRTMRGELLDSPSDKPAAVESADPSSPPKRRILALAVDGTVFDVSEESDYSIFAGRDASRGMAKYSFEPSMVSEEYDPLEDLTKAEVDSMTEWHGFFLSKYTRIGWLEVAKTPGGPLERVGYEARLLAKQQSKSAQSSPSMKE